MRHVIRSAENFKNALIFCNRKRDVQVVYRSLEKHGFSVGALHGDLDQRSRMAALDAFRNNTVQLLVCSDVAARGLDIPDVSHVINYDAPHHSEDYVHRIGRTGRAGKLGVAVTIVSRADARSIDEIEKLIGQKIEWQAGGDTPVDEPAEAEEAPRSIAAAAAAQRRRSRSRRPQPAEGAAAERAVAAVARRVAEREPQRQPTEVLRRARNRSPAAAAAGGTAPAAERKRRGARAATTTAKRGSSGLAITCRASCCARSACRPSRSPPKRKTNQAALGPPPATALGRCGLSDAAIASATGGPRRWLAADRAGAR